MYVFSIIGRKKETTQGILPKGLNPKSLVYTWTQFTCQDSGLWAEAPMG